MKRPARLRLYDMRTACDEVAEMVRGLDLAGFKADFRTRRAVERCIEIVSEASRHIPDATKETHSDQPWREIAAIGNLLRHEYRYIDDEIIWRIASKSLPSLRPVIVAMIAESEK
jgi:uncharacterized protein with HEPN domain